MILCTLCHFDCPLDDVVVAAAERRCICLRCYAGETDMTKPVPKPQRRELMAALAALEAA